MVKHAEEQHPKSFKIKSQNRKIRGYPKTVFKAKIEIAFLLKKN